MATLIRAINLLTGGEPTEMIDLFILNFVYTILLPSAIFSLAYLIYTSSRNCKPKPKIEPPPIALFNSSDYKEDPKLHLLLCASGSVATIKIPNILHALAPYSERLSIRLIFTNSASQFLQGQSEEQPHLQTLLSIPGVDGLYTDADEWLHPWSRQGPAGSVPILHIELRKWADLMVVAPLSANTMAKIVAGMSDGLLTSVVRAWDTDGLVDYGVREAWRNRHGMGESTQLALRNIGELDVEDEEDELGVRRKKILVAPAMNTAMFRQPVTNRHLEVLCNEWGGRDGWIEVLLPDAKKLACGDVGEGAMREWSGIVEEIKGRMGFD